MGKRGYIGERPVSDLTVASNALAYSVAILMNIGARTADGDSAVPS